MNREQKLIEYLERFVEEHKDRHIHLIDVSQHLMILKEIEINFKLKPVMKCLPKALPPEAFPQYPYRNRGSLSNENMRKKG